MRVWESGIEPIWGLQRLIELIYAGPAAHGWRHVLIPDFETLLPRLVATYGQGRLVPFVSSGMSRRACTDWPTLIASLEASAG